MIFCFETNSLVDLFAALLTPTVAIFGLYIARQQYLLNRKNIDKDDYSKIVRIISDFNDLQFDIRKDKSFNQKQYHLLIKISYELDVLVGKKCEDIMLDILNDIIFFSADKHHPNRTKARKEKLEDHFSKISKILENKLDEITKRTKK